MSTEILALTLEQFRLAGLRLRELRAARGLTQKAFGLKAGYGQAAVSLAECGGRQSGQMPSAGLLLTLASTLGADLDELTAECGHCHGKPPAGYACLSCASERAA